MIYLMRHGADDPNRLGGWSPYGLTEEGTQQAREACARLTDKEITAVYSSDLPRAAETAEIVANALHLPVEWLPSFREGNNGKLAGMLVTEAAEQYPGVWWSTLEWTQSWAGGESPKDFFDRIAAAWQAFRKANRDRSVLLITHSGVINAILCMENGIPCTNRETRFRIGYAEVICLNI